LGVDVKIGALRYAAGAGRRTHAYFGGGGGVNSNDYGYITQSDLYNA